MNFKEYEELYNLIDEAPHIEFSNQYIDLEAERHLIIPRVIRILLGQQVTDKYGSKFQLKSPKEIAKFIKDVLKEPMVARFLNKEIQAMV